MNEVKCAKEESLNEIAQGIIDRLDSINGLSNGIDERLYKGDVPNCKALSQPAPVSLFDKLLCIRSLTDEIGSTLGLVRERI